MPMSPFAGRLRPGVLLVFSLGLILPLLASCGSDDDTASESPSPTVIDFGRIDNPSQTAVPASITAPSPIQVPEPVPLESLVKFQIPISNGTNSPIEIVTIEPG